MFEKLINSLMLKSLRPRVRKVFYTDNDSIKTLQRLKLKGDGEAIFLSKDKDGLNNNKIKIIY